MTGRLRRQLRLVALLALSAGCGDDAPGDAGTNTESDPDSSSAMDGQAPLDVAADGGALHSGEASVGGGEPNSAEFIRCVTYDSSGEVDGCEHAELGTAAAQSFGCIQIVTDSISIKREDGPCPEEGAAGYCPLTINYNGQQIPLQGGRRYYYYDKGYCGYDGGEWTPVHRLDAGEPAVQADAAVDEGAAVDAGLPEGAVRCGQLVCEGSGGLLGIDRACCTQGADGSEACGWTETGLPGVDETTCVLRNAPGVESASCGELWDSTDDVAEAVLADAGITDANDGVYTQVDKFGSGLRRLQYTGCCTSAGTCSIQFQHVHITLDQLSLGEADQGFGCANPVYAGLDDESESLGMGQTISCDPVSGAALETPGS